MKNFEGLEQIPSVETSRKGGKSENIQSIVVRKLSCRMAPFCEVAEGSFQNGEGLLVERAPSLNTVFEMGTNKTVDEYFEHFTVDKRKMFEKIVASASGVG